MKFDKLKNSHSDSFLWLNFWYVAVIYSPNVRLQRRLLSSRLISLHFHVFYLVMMMRAQNKPISIMTVMWRAWKEIACWG